MKHEMTLFNKMRPNRNILFFYSASFSDHIWSHAKLFSEIFNVRWSICKSPITALSLYLVMTKYFKLDKVTWSDTVKNKNIVVVLLASKLK